MNKTGRLGLRVVAVPPRAIMVVTIPEHWSAERVDIVCRTLEGMKQEYNCDAVLVLTQGAGIEMLGDKELEKLGLRRVAR